MSDATTRKVERSRLALLLGIGVLAVDGVRAPASAQGRLPEVTVYRSPT